MSTQSVLDPEGTLAALRSAVDATSLALSCVTDLGSMFCAIEQLAPEGSLPRALAGIGRYLADDWANSADLERESCETRLQALREVQS